MEERCTPEYPVEEGCTPEYKEGRGVRPQNKEGRGATQFIMEGGVHCTSINVNKQYKAYIRKTSAYSLPIKDYTNCKLIKPGYPSLLSF